jgi:hypothetical protein
MRVGTGLKVGHAAHRTGERMACTERRTSWGDTQKMWQRCLNKRGPQIIREIGTYYADTGEVGDEVPRSLSDFLQSMKLERRFMRRNLGAGVNCIVPWYHGSEDPTVEEGTTRGSQTVGVKLWDQLM